MRREPLESWGVLLFGFGVVKINNQHVVCVCRRSRFVRVLEGPPPDYNRGELMIEKGQTRMSPS